MARIRLRKVGGGWPIFLLACIMSLSTAGSSGGNGDSLKNGDNIWQKLISVDDQLLIELYKVNLKKMKHKKWFSTAMSVSAAATVFGSCFLPMTIPPMIKAQDAYSDITRALNMMNQRKVLHDSKLQRYARKSFSDNSWQNKTYDLIKNGCAFFIEDSTVSFREQDPKIDIEVKLDLEMLRPENIIQTLVEHGTNDCKSLKTMLAEEINITIPQNFVGAPEIRIRSHGQDFLVPVSFEG